MITMRVAERADVPMLAEICSECIHPAWTKQMFLSEFDMNSIIMCACDGDKIVGFAVMGVTFDDGYTDLVAVSGKYRCQGIAHRMLFELETLAYKRGVRRNLLEVRVSNTAAIDLYDGCGYTVLCTRQRFYSHPVEDAYTMVKELGIENENTGY